MLPHRRLATHLARSLATVACLGTTACTDGPTGPGGVVGFYRLASVDGEPLPVAVLPEATIFRGELLLRPDGTFGLGIASEAGDFVSGPYRGTGAGLELGFPASTSDPTQRRWRQAPVRGDSVVLVITVGEGGPGSHFELRYVFRRGPLPAAPISAGRFIMTSTRHSSSTPFILHEYPRERDGSRLVATVVFDTLTFSDGLFFRQHRLERHVRYLAAGDSLVFRQEWNAPGVYTPAPGRLVLQSYNQVDLFGVLRKPDTLSVESPGLVRRTSVLVTSVERTEVVERYSAER